MIKLVFSDVCSLSWHHDDHSAPYFILFSISSWSGCLAGVSVLAAFSQSQLLLWSWGLVSWPSICTASPARSADSTVHSFIHLSYYLYKKANKCRCFQDADVLQECDVTLMPGNLYSIQGQNLYCQAHYHSNGSVPLPHNSLPDPNLREGETISISTESNAEHKTPQTFNHTLICASSLLLPVSFFNFILQSYYHLTILFSLYL